MSKKNTNNKKEKVNKEKYKNILLYFIKRMDKYEVGSTKLAKLLYYLDFISYRDRKKEVTNASYYKQTFGPFVEDFYEIINELKEDGYIEIERLKLEDGREVDNYVSLKEPNKEVFEKEEIELMRKLVEKYKKWNADLLVAKTHSELPWRKVEYGDKLDLSLADSIDDFDEDAKKEYREENKKMKKALNMQ